MDNIFIEEVISTDTLWLTKQFSNWRDDYFSYRYHEIQDAAALPTSFSSNANKKGWWPVVGYCWSERVLRKKEG